MASNRLAYAVSPYLLQHADNPVDWWPWGPQALAAARAANKPILLSVGYAACHWCHVMAHECFENRRIADLMNDLYINIKVDREERPDIDTIYQTALAALGQQGGWPLTMFLTPEGEPFWGGTYFPAEPRYGRPGFPDILRAVRETFDREPEKIAKNVAGLTDALTKVSTNHPGGDVGLDMLDQIAERLSKEIDPFWGGIGQAPKFPHGGILQLLWRAHIRTGHAAYLTAVTKTLDQMCQGGIYDHLGGGFARYSTDAEWLAPHFEKMLYDNAQMLDVLVEVWQGTESPLYATRIAETIDWIGREMVAEGGGFAATLDADSEGEEGRYYVWSAAEVHALLGPRTRPFAQVYDVTVDGNWEGKTILNRRHNTALLDPEAEQALAADRAVLKQARDQRVRPGWDDKVLSDWNGLAIAAIAQAGLVFDRPDWVAMADRAFSFVIGTMVVDGRLTHTWRAGRAQHPATLDGIANMARAALALAEATGDQRYIEQAVGWVEEADAHYADAHGGGYFFTADDAEALIIRTKTAYDNPVPAGNGTLLGVFARLFAVTGEAKWLDRADRLIAAFSGELGRNFFPMATFLNGIEFLRCTTLVVIVGPPSDPATRALVRAAMAPAVPNRLLTLVAPDRGLPRTHPASGKGMKDGLPTAYVCVGMTCRPPVADPETLRQHLLEQAKLS